MCSWLHHALMRFWGAIMVTKVLIYCRVGIFLLTLLPSTQVNFVSVQHVLTLRFYLSKLRILRANACTFCDNNTAWLYQHLVRIAPS